MPTENDEKRSHGLVSLKERWMKSPVFVRVAPFVLFLGLTTLQDSFGETGQYWVYLIKTVLGLGLIFAMRPLVGEMRWALSWEAVVIGIGVFALWVGLDGLYPKWEVGGKGWEPFKQFGEGAGLAWLFIIVRILGSTFVVPPLEEVFYRSYLYRNVVRADFLSVPFTTFSWPAFLFSCGIFGFSHPHQWLAGILCGMAYQWLVIRKGRLGDAMTAHAITNFLLGLWIVWRGDWKFW